MPTARILGSDEDSEIAGILCVFQGFGIARMGQKARRSAAADLFGGYQNKTGPLWKAVHGNTALNVFLCRTAIDSASQSLVTVRQIFSDGPAETMG